LYDLLRTLQTRVPEVCFKFQPLLVNCHNAIISHGLCFPISSAHITSSVVSNYFTLQVELVELEKLVQLLASIKFSWLLTHLPRQTQTHLNLQTKDSFEKAQEPKAFLCLMEKVGGIVLQYAQAKGMLILALLETLKFVWVMQLKVASFFSAPKALQCLMVVVLGTLLPWA